MPAAPRGIPPSRERACLLASSLPASEHRQLSRIGRSDPPGGHGAHRRRGEAGSHQDRRPHRPTFLRRHRRAAELRQPLRGAGLRRTHDTIGESVEKNIDPLLKNHGRLRDRCRGQGRRNAARACHHTPRPSGVDDSGASSTGAVVMECVSIIALQVSTMISCGSGGPASVLMRMNALCTPPPTNTPLAFQREQIRTVHPELFAARPARLFVVEDSSVGRLRILLQSKGRDRTRRSCIHRLEQDNHPWPSSTSSN